MPVNWCSTVFSSDYLILKGFVCLYANIFRMSASLSLLALALKDVVFTVCLYFMAELGKPKLVFPNVRFNRLKKSHKHWSIL